MNERHNRIEAFKSAAFDDFIVSMAALFACVLLGALAWLLGNAGSVSALLFSLIPGLLSLWSGAAFLNHAQSSLSSFRAAEDASNDTGNDPEDSLN